MVRIAVVGSLMMDLVVRAPRLAREGESLIGRSFGTFIGGKGGNQATAAARLGAEVAMIGRVGADDFGRAITAQLANEGIDTTNISIDDAEGTGVAVPIVLDDGANAIYALPRANLALAPAHIEAARDAITSSDMLVIQFETGMEAVVAAIRTAVGAGVPVLLNPAPIAPHPPESVSLPTVIVVNEVEAAALAPSAGGNHVAEALALSGPAGRLAVVTLGEKGAVFAHAGETAGQSPFLVEAVDSVGAGDAFCGALAVALANGRPHAEAVRFASAAGALAVTRPGATAGLPTIRELESFLNAR